MFEYRDWVKQRPAVNVDQKRRIMALSYVMCGVLAVLAVICLVVLLQIRPLQLQLLAGLVVLGGASVLMFRRADANRRSLRRATAPEVSENGAYPLSVGDEEIHFPESFDDPEETWPLEGTTVRITTVTKQDVIALTRPGGKTPHFYARALVAPLTEVEAEIEQRQGRLKGPEAPTEA